MAQDIYRKHAFVPGPIGRSWCDVTEDGHLCGRLASHPIHQPRKGATVFATSLNTATTTPRDRQNLRDACMSGLVPCSPDCHGDRTLKQGAQRDANGAAWTALLAAARRDRAERVAARSPRDMSLSSAAQDCGLVPGYGALHREAGCCAAWQTVQRNAASVLRWRYAHRDRPAVYALTVWAEAR